VRQAMMHAIDRQRLIDDVFKGTAIIADSIYPPSMRLWYDRTLKKYPYDQARARALLEEAGWHSDADGMLQKNGHHFNLTIRDADGEQDALAVASNWKAIGVTATYEPRTTALLRDRQDRATFTGVEMTSNPMAILSASRRLASINIPTAENRWSGSNRGGYNNPAWDELDRRAYGSLQERERIDIEREMVRLYTADLPALPLYFRMDTVPVGGGIRGPVPNTGVAHRGFILHTWNIADWDIQPS